MSSVEAFWLSSAGEKGEVSPFLLNWDQKPVPGLSPDLECCTRGHTAASSHSSESHSLASLAEVSPPAHHCLSRSVSEVIGVTRFSCVCSVSPPHSGSPCRTWAVSALLVTVSEGPRVTRDTGLFVSVTAGLADRKPGSHVWSEHPGNRRGNE